MFLNYVRRPASRILLRWLFIAGAGMAPCLAPAADATPPDPLMRGQALLENGERDKAIDALTVAIRLKPSDARAYYLRASLYQRNGQADFAGADLTTAAQIDPAGLRDYFARGWAYGRKRQIDRAAEQTTILMAKDPLRAREYRAMRGVYYYLEGKLDKAIVDLDELIRLDPNDANSYVNRGLCHLEKGNLDKAMADMTEAIRQQPRTAPFYVNRAWVFDSQGNYDKAITDANNGLMIDSGQAEAYAAGGFARERRNEQAKADDDYAIAVGLESANLHAQDVRFLYSYLSDARKTLYLPAFSWLSEPGNRDYVHISPDQEKRLNELSERLEREFNEWIRGHYERIAMLPPEQQAKENELVAKRLAEDKLNCRKFVAEILTPEQRETCRTYALYSSATTVADNPRYDQKVGFTAQQRKELWRLTQQYKLHAEEEKQDRIDRMLALLDRVQTATLRAEIARQGRAAAESSGQNATEDDPFSGNSAGGYSGTLTLAESTTLSVPRSYSSDPAEAMVYFSGLSEYRELARPEIRARLRLTDDQTKRLTGIAQEFGAAKAKLDAQFSTAAAKPDPDPFVSEVGRIQKSLQLLREGAGRKVAGVLAPQQLAALKDLRFREAALTFLRDFVGQDRIGLSDAHMEALRDIMRYSPEKSIRREEEFYEQIVKLLTPEQKKKLEAALSEDM